MHCRVLLCVCVLLCPVVPVVTYRVLQCDSVVMGCNVITNNTTVSVRLFMLHGFDV